MVTILIADDDIALAETIGLRCEKMGLETIIVDNAQCALQSIISDQPDLAILDINMPRADAGDVLELLATIPDLSYLPVIVLTGRKDRVTIQRCDSLSAYYVAKQRNVWNQLKPIIREIVTQKCSLHDLTVTWS